MRIAIIGGTGIGERLRQRMEPEGVVTHRPDTDFGWPSSEIVQGRISPKAKSNGAQGEPVDVLLLNRHGRGHKIPPHRLPYRANIFALKMLGATHVIATGATGSLREAIAPGELVVCDQIIDRTVNRARTFFDDAAVHVELAEPFCPVMRRWIAAAADRLDVGAHHAGTYVCIEGPSFSTRAESNMHRTIGGDVVGMTAMPEARLAREAELPYALLALPTDYDAWREDSDTVLTSIHANLERAVDGAFNLIEEALADVAVLRSERSPAADALEHAIWTDKPRIRAGEIERLAVLWRRHFEQAQV